MDRMVRTALILCFMFGVSHAYSTALFKMLNQFNKTQQAMVKRLEALDTISAKTSASLVPETVLEQKFEDRLKLLERRVTALKNYLVKEKETDIQLKVAAKTAIDDINMKVAQSSTRKVELESEIRKSLRDFDKKILNVNKTAHLTVNVKGVVFIGSIGSTCSSDTDDCNNPNSQCRDGKCQCDIGLSFDNERNECRDRCTQYGCTFQSARHRIIREFNDKTAENVSLADCKKLCIEETDFLCVSFDYFPRWKTCYMSANTMREVPDDAWEYNSAGSHFQRDCLGVAELSLCNENQP